MPIDPRIALAGVSPTYDFMGAFNTSRAAARTDLTNQMAQQAAEATATAQRNAMLEARTLDPTNQEALRAYALRNPAAAEQVLGGLASADNIFSARNTDTRAQAEAATKQSEAYMAQLPQFASQLLGDASPPVIARVRAQWEGSGFPVGVFDALATRLADLPPEQQQQAIQSYLLTTGGGKTAVETRFGPRTLVNTGATQEARNLNPLALDAATGAPVPVTGPIQNTPDPRAPTIFSSSQGAGQISSEGTFTPVTDAEGNPIMPYQAPSAGAAAADETRQNAAEGVRSTIDSMLGYYENLERMKGIVSTERGPAENIVASIGASLPGRVVGRTIGSREQTERDNIQTAIPMLVASLKDLTGMSAQQMNSNVELQLFLNTVSAPDQSIETVREAFARFGRYVDSVSGSGAGGGPAADPLEGRTAVGPGGRRLVRRDGQWVPQ
jgi:hypothetical protein